MCFYSLKVAYSGLIKRKGFNQEIQNKHFQSQLVFVVAVTLLSVEMLVNEMIKLASLHKGNSWFQTTTLIVEVDVVFWYINAGKPLLMLFFILTLPIVRTTLKYILTCRRKKMQTKVMNYSKEAFLCSQMNMELVCSILQGINKTIEEFILNSEETDFSPKEDEYAEKQEIKVVEVQVLKKDIFTNASISKLLWLRKQQNTYKETNKDSFAIFD